MDRPEFASGLPTIRIDDHLPGGGDILLAERIRAAPSLSLAEVRRAISA